MLPAARKTDATMCEHGEGCLELPCCAKVKAGTLATARFADRIKCTSPFDAVKEGAATVLMGGLPAARSSDATYHTGKIVSGLTSVKVGGAKVTGKQTSNGNPTNNFIAYDPERGRLYIVSYLEYYGPDATQAYADAAKKQIEDTWGRTTTIDGKPVDVRVQVNTSVNPTGAPTPGYDRINVDGKTARSNQQLGGGQGNQNPADIGGRLLVAAHEYGHTLGIDDDYSDQPGGGSVPDPAKTKNLKRNIMAQTWPDELGQPPQAYPEHYEEMLRNAK